jgi:hypothetical protein
MRASLDRAANSAKGYALEFLQKLICCRFRSTAIGQEEFTGPTTMLKWARSGREASAGRGTHEDVDVVETDSVKVRPVASDTISLSYHEQ